MRLPEIEAALVRAGGRQYALDVAFIEDKDLSEPWRRSTVAPQPDLYEDVIDRVVVQGYSAWSIIKE